jgi:hypothetical protein
MIVKENTRTNRQYFSQHLIRSEDHEQVSTAGDVASREIVVHSDERRDEAMKTTEKHAGGGER